MKRILFLLCACILVTCSTTDSPIIEKLIEAGPVKAALKSAPFSRGVNFSAWFESSSAHAIPFTKYTEQDFIDVKSLGADVIRLPIKMHSMTSGAPNYTLDPLLLKFLDIAADWAEKHEIYLIIDNHSFDPVIATSPDIDKILIPVWNQIARHFRNRSKFIIYEILNEPHGISDQLWGEIQWKAVQEIRKFDPNRPIIVGGTGYNSIGKLSAIPRYPDPNLIYTFHFYDPHLFTHQGATWGGPPVLVNLKGLPFPADRSRMPGIPRDLRGTWVENNIRNNYFRDANPARLSAALDVAVAFALERDVPIFCGEFGVLMNNCENQDRVRWYSYVTSALENRNISRTSWDYYGGFGMFNDDRGRFNHDLNVGVARALGFTPPVQTLRTTRTLNEGFIIFDDYPNHQYLSSADAWGSEGMDFSLYDANSASGEFAIRWGNAARYNSFNFTFDRSSNDLSTLVKNNFFLEFKARTDKPVSFDVRFVNPENVSSVPWRIRYSVNEVILVPNGRWQTIRIPLSQMTEHGAWINTAQTWRQPIGEFAWNNIARLEFVSEHMALTDIRIWFDDIKITR